MSFEVRHKTTVERLFSVFLRRRNCSLEVFSTNIDSHRATQMPAKVVILPIPILNKEQLTYYHIAVPFERNPKHIQIAQENKGYQKGVGKYFVVFY